MSLFRTKEWWRVDCGSEETFDGQSLLVVPFFGADRKDVIIVGSHSGYLRIYSPSCTWNEESNSVTGYKITDLIIETHIVDCIIDLKAGKFVSGSQELQLAILTPSKLIVYRVTLSPGSTEHGDRCSVETLYQHELPRFPASLIAGPFGSVQGRDFFCVQCLDATLVFFEQEAHTFDQVLADRLLPQSLTYVARNDVFVTSSAGWVLECYRYQNMAEFGRLVEERDMADDRRLRPDWTYNLGEAVLGIAPVTLSTFEVGIVVLGQRNLYCFRDNCSSIKYTKHLDYNPLCFHAYVIEPDGKLMVLVVADTDTLLLYEGTTLKWSAQLPFTPVAIARAQFQSLEGVIVILSETGRLEACYLGAEPSLFVAPPIHRRGFDYKAAEKELAELRKMAKSSSTSGVPNATLESELLITVHVSQELSSSSLGQDEAEDTCRIGVELSSYSPLVDVQIYLQPLPPLGITEDFYSFSSLRDRQLVQTTVFIQGDLPGLSSIVHLTASYELEGEFRIVQKTIQLPLRMLLRPCPPENTASFATTIKCADPLVNLSQLFPEFIERQSNALGLRHNRTGHVVTIVAGTNTNRYRVQSNEPLSMTLVVEQLLSRLRARAPGSIVASISQNLQLVQLHIETHFESRQRVKRASKEIAALSGQLRAIEKRLLRAMRDTSAKSLSSSGLTILLDWTYNAMKKELDQLQAAHAEREQAGHALQCALRLLLLLLRPNVQDDKYTMLESAIGFEPQLREDVDWEEVADVALFALLRVTSKKPENEPSTRQLTWNKFESAQDLVKLKKRLVHAVERLNKPVDTVQEDESDNFTT